MSRRSRAGRIAAVVGFTLACDPTPLMSSDPLLDGDFVLPPAGRLIELLPGIPWRTPGPDERLGSDDDVVDDSVVGDVDLVVRAGTLDEPSLPGPLQVTGPLRVVAIGRGQGPGVPFTVWATDGGDPPMPVVSEAVEGNPVLVMAFADLDGDGFVGITEEDGNPGDHELEERELDDVGRRFAVLSEGRAQGVLRVSVGGSADDPIAIVLAAAAYTGETRADYFEGFVPDGPIVMTSLPFFPRTDPEDVISAGGPAGPDVLIGAEVDAAFTPDLAEHPLDADYALAVDGSPISVDVVVARAGPPVAFQFYEDADPAGQGSVVVGPGAAGRRLLSPLIEGLQGPGDAPGAWVLHARDELGNPATLAVPHDVELRAGGGLRILSPDFDGDPSREQIPMVAGMGVPVTVDASGARAQASVVAESSLGLAVVRVRRIDGDADRDGVMDLADNCVEVANPGQEDLDAGSDDDATLPGDQHYGDACDADLDGDGRVASSDFFGFLRPCLGQPVDGVCAAADLDGSGEIGASDFFAGMRPALGTLAGPGVTTPSP